MSRKKTRDFLAVVFVGLMVMTGKMIFIWLLIGTCVLLHPENGHSPKKMGRYKTHRKIEKDSQRYGVRVPKDRSIRKLLAQVYDRYFQSSRIYPNLKPQYDEIMEDFWESLVMNSSEDNWRYLLSTVLSEWPMEKATPQSRMKKRLEEVKKLAKQWDDAQKEAMGEV